MNDSRHLPEIVEIFLQQIHTDTAIDSGKVFPNSFIARFIRSTNATDSHLSWPILVNSRDGEYRLLSGAFFLQAYLYMGIEKAACIVYHNLNEIDEIRCASAAQMCKPVAGARLAHYLYLRDKVKNGSGKQSRRRKIGRIMGETGRQIQKYEFLCDSGNEQVVQDVINNKISITLALRLIKAHH